MKINYIGLISVVGFGLMMFISLYLATNNDIRSLITFGFGFGFVINGCLCLALKEWDKEK